MIVFYRVEIDGDAHKVTLSCGVPGFDDVCVRVCIPDSQVEDKSCIADHVTSLIPATWPTDGQSESMPGWLSFDSDEEVRARNEAANKGRKFFHLTNTLAGKEIPDSWPGVAEFADWWLGSGQPICVPPNPQIYCSDDATSVCLFRHGQFQVELYLIFPHPNLPVHSHPGVDVIELRLDEYQIIDGKATAVTNYCASDPILSGEKHGDGVNFKESGEMGTGFPLLAIQRWHDGITPSTVAARWRGKPVGPMQSKLVDSNTAGALITDSFIDVMGG